MILILQSEFVIGSMWGWAFSKLYILHLFLNFGLRFGISSHFILLIWPNRFVQILSFAGKYYHLHNLIQSLVKFGYFSIS